MNENATQQFTATAYDQFGNALADAAVVHLGAGQRRRQRQCLRPLYGPGQPGSASVTASSGAVSGTGSVTVNNAAPTVAHAGLGNACPVTGTTTVLSVLGADDGGEANLTYTWVATGTPPAPVSFSVNGTNASKNTTATFPRPGTTVSRSRSPTPADSPPPVPST